MPGWRRWPGSRLTVHSDQGSQFTSREWQSFLRQHGLEPSMSRRGNCHDNAVAESFFQLLKRERIPGYFVQRWETRKFGGSLQRRRGQQWFVDRPKHAAVQPDTYRNRTQPCRSPLAHVVRDNPGPVPIGGSRGSHFGGHETLRDIVLKVADCASGTAAGRPVQAQIQISEWGQSVALR